MQTFADRLHQFRERAGLTQQQLAAASDINLWTIRGYEQGRREPNWKAAIALAKALGVAVEAFADCISADGGEEAPAQRAARPLKATPAPPPAADLEQEGTKRHQEGPKPPRGRNKRK